MSVTSDDTHWSEISNLSDDGMEPMYKKSWTSYFFIQIYNDRDYTHMDSYQDLENSVSDEVSIKGLRLNHSTHDENPDHWNIMPIDDHHSKVYIHRKLLPSSGILRHVAELIDDIWHTQDTSLEEDESSEDEDVSDDGDESDGGDDPC